MNSTQKYLDQLIADRDTIVENINAKGGRALATDTFTELAPKILSIPSGEENLAEEMEMIDIYHNMTNLHLRPINEKDYTQTEVDKVDDLLNKLGGDING